MNVADEAEDEVDAYELLTAVDILALLPKDFYEKIVSLPIQHLLMTEND